MILLGNAAGFVKSPADIEPLLRVDCQILQEITLGSYTPKSRTGNSGDVYWDDEMECPTSLNALGLPNPGLWEAKRFLFEACRDIRKNGKIPRISLAGFSIEDYKKMTAFVSAFGFQEAELNLGCPNIRDGEAQKPIFAFNPRLVGEIIDAVHTVTDHVGAPSVAVKLSPYSDPELLSEVAKVIASKAHAVQKVVTTNTFPNAYGVTAGNPNIGANNGYAGLGGRAMKYIALGQVRQFREFLPKEISVIGVGGVSHGQDALDLESVGASHVQVGTAFAKYGPKIFRDICSGM